ncbi:MAG: metal-dependent hydrolase [Novosphingobium sp. 32-60-15]|uniref:amidohydrolase n=1 Tax=unclassified Novosphingobium TaxID=2644732 RepID=UPI000BDCD068|nr:MULTISPECIES: amidohydrolase [unclassified Novosphingobium]OYX62137.1 MAG: metal-dependent hydrolase [Novosphingobium sp. 32-60-15]
MNRARLTLAALLLSTSAPALADTLIDNVRGTTIGANGQPESFTGLLFDNAGTIVRVIHAGEKKPKPKKDYQYHLDGKGRVMLPGMIDAHAHVMGMGFAALSLDLSETTSLAQALEKIRTFVAEHPDRPWIVGRGWNQELWQLGRFPTAAELDAVTGNRPVWLERVDGHAGWANTAALKAAGVTAASKDPAGGKLERNADGSPQGVFVDTAMELVSARLPAPRAEDRDVAFATAQQILFKRGVTAVADMGTSIDDWQAYRRAGDANRLYVRVMAYAAGVEQMSLIGGPGPSPWLYADRLRLNGVKLYLDGALGSRGAWLKAPYADAPATSGLPQLSETQLGNLMSRAAMDNFQIAVHAIGDKGNAAAIGAIDDLSATYKGDRRWRIEHAQIVDPRDFARFGQNGVIASVQPVHQTSDRTMAEARLGPDRLAGAYPWKSLQAAGAKLAFGSDAPVEQADPWAGFAAAISRQGPDGQPTGGWQAQERVDRTTALAAYTSGAAFAGFAEKRFGRLAPGLRADFIVVDTDPMSAGPEQIRATKVIETWIGGGLVWSAEQPVK